METITIFGVALPYQRRTDIGTDLWADYGDLVVSVQRSTRTEDDWYVSVSTRDVSVSVYRQPTLAEAERAWLELASLETPRLCALVVDLMAASKTGAA